jgi:putative transcriptional regulator
MKSELFEDLEKSIKEAGKIRRGRAKAARVFRYNAVDIRKLRESVKVSQSTFARMIGVSPATVQNWEQGRRTPRGPAMALLRVFEENPKLVVGALGEQGKAV